MWRRLEGEDFDALIFWKGNGDGFTYDLKNLAEFNIPKFLICGDTHDAINICEYYNIRFDELALYFGFDALFYEHDNYWAEQFYPKDKFNYWCIYLGIEKEDYKNISDFKPRIKNKILCTGALAGFLYVLRKKCSKLNSIDYWSAKAKRNKTKQTFMGNSYPKLLQKYRASIAATTPYATNKYLELPAAVCLTFMEVTEQNHADLLGFKDGVNAIFINENNYKQKFDEYLKDPDNPKWEQIAKAGREFVMNNHTTDHCVDKLIQKIKQFIKDNPRENNK